jgi:hypothetical protein
VIWGQDEEKKAEKQGEEVKEEQPKDIIENEAAEEGDDIKEQKSKLQEQIDAHEDPQQEEEHVEYPNLEDPQD